MATAFAVTIGSRWAARRMPVPSRSVVVADEAAASATSGSSVRLYSSGSGRPLGCGVRRLVGMCVCSGSHSEPKPRSSAARASSTMSIDTSVANIVIP